MKKWKMDNTTSAKYVYIEEDDQLARHVAAVLVNDYVAKSSEQHHAEATEKAKLIAAAPDLLAACEELVEVCMYMRDASDGNDPALENAIKQGHIAMAKATN